jgi:hypothetical protein
MNKVTNTAVNEVNEAWLFGGNPVAIEAQESKGQQELVSSEVLPTECTDWDKLKELGVVVKDKVAGDDMFTNVELPAGWKKKATDHAMWCDLLNESDEVVATIFYKAAFYARSATMYVK